MISISHCICHRENQNWNPLFFHQIFGGSVFFFKTNPIDSFRLMDLLKIAIFHGKLINYQNYQTVNPFEFRFIDGYIYVYDRETFRYHFVPVNSDKI